MTDSGRHGEISFPPIQDSIDRPTLSEMWILTVDL